MTFDARLSLPRPRKNEILQIFFLTLGSLGDPVVPFLIGRLHALRDPTRILTHHEIEDFPDVIRMGGLLFCKGRMQIPDRLDV